VTHAIFQLTNGNVTELIKRWKIGSFGFACVSACAVGAKPNVPMCGWQNFKIFCAVTKKIKHDALGCRVGKRSAVKFICIPVSLMVVVSVFTLAYNSQISTITKHL